MYQGYTNWDTWAVNLWAGNDYGLYKRGVALMAAMLKREQRGNFDADKARNGIIRYYKAVAREARRNGDDVVNRKVNWDELVEMFMDTYEDYKREPYEAS